MSSPGSSAPETGRDSPSSARISLNAPAELLAELLAHASRVRVEVTGGSMHPALRSGDTVLLERVEPTALRPGEIILFRHPLAGRPVLHRLVGVRCPAVGGASFVARGDSLPEDDPPLRAEDLLGRVVAVERRGWDTERATRGALAPVPAWRRTLVLFLRRLLRP